MAAVVVKVLLFVMLVWTTVNCASLLGQPRSSQTLPHLCGMSLVQTLRFVCDGNYFPMFKKKFPPQYDERLLEELPMFPFIGIPHNTELSSEEELAKEGLRVPRGIADECCNRRCSLLTLKSYCAA